MTIKYRRQATATRSTRTQTHTWAQGDRLADDGDVDVFDDECKETFITKSDVSLATVATSGARRQSVSGSSVVKNMVAETSDRGEKIARQFTLGILTKFSQLRQKLQRDHWDMITSTNTTKFAVIAGSKMLELKWYHDFNDVGHVPGVRVGDWYSYTYELLLIGLHRHLRGNICHLSSTSELSKTKYKNLSVVCSIVIGENDHVSGDSLLFIGQGGKQKQSRAETGNLAMMNSCNLSLPVRVIRREKDMGSTTGQRLTYYGLYKVLKFILDTGIHGHSVYKFFLQREGGQPSLESFLPKPFTKPDPSSSPGVLLTPDISEGVEQTPVRVVNGVDVNAPDTFHYITTVVYPHRDVPVHIQACECHFGCEDGICPCVKKNSGGVLAYNDDGHLIRVRNIVYECGSFCNCSHAACRNRVSQKGLKWHLEIFRTMSKGWGVRTLEFIPSGSFLCELTGELLTATAAADRENDEYLFNLDFHKNARGRGKPSKSKRQALVEELSAHYVIDCRLSGNVARFINHSCNPNLFVQGVLHDHGDLNRGHIMLFAGEDIAAGTELAYDYGYELNSVRDIHGNVVAKQCLCGVSICRKRMY